VVSARIQHAPPEMNVGFGSARVRFRSWVRTHAEKVLERLRGCCRQPTPQRVHPRYILALTCEYLAVHDTGRRAARTGRTRAGRREDAQTPGLAAVAPTRRRRGPDGPHHANDDKPALPRNTCRGTI
jgi:hypothetical protein